MGNLLETRVRAAITVGTNLEEKARWNPTENEDAMKVRTAALSLFLVVGCGGEQGESTPPTPPPRELPQPALRRPPRYGRERT
jgi:hypothetical protein